MVRYRIAEGAQAELLQDTWAAYSPLSGETLQLNTEAAAILELLGQGPMDAATVCDALARDAQTDVAVVSEALRHVWDALISAGLVRIDEDASHNSG